MLKNFTILTVLMLCLSCAELAENTCLLFSTPTKCISPRKSNIFGRQTYKYRCEKAGQCCEVGKNCEEDLKKNKEEK
jgi:hypothetical protein